MLDGWKKDESLIDVVLAWKERQLVLERWRKLLCLLVRGRLGFLVDEGLRRREDDVDLFSKFWKSGFEFWKSGFEFSKFSIVDDDFLISEAESIGPKDAKF